MCRMSFKKETPLANAAFWAARRGNLTLLRLLLNSGRVDVDCRDSVRPFGTRMPQAHHPLLARQLLLNTLPFVVLVFLVCWLALSFAKSPAYPEGLQSRPRKPL
uniref:Ankyrin repeat domain 29 n=2 Tax=Sus scrofa TaxID=9823 RepID=A0A4X1VM79_PIG